MTIAAVSRLLSKPSNLTNFSLTARCFLSTSSPSLTRTRCSSPIYDFFHPNPVCPPSSLLNNPLKHWLVFVNGPDRFRYCDRDEIIMYYILTLEVLLLRSEKEAKSRIDSVSTRHYHAFGALLTDEQVIQLEQALEFNADINPLTADVVPDPYIYFGKKEYKGEPFINGEAVPYDPKYHEEWTRIHGDEVDEVAEIAEEAEVYEKDELDDYFFKFRCKRWGVIMYGLNGSRDELINIYINTLAHVVGSEEEARKRIYWISTTREYAFAAYMSYETACILDDMELPGVVDVRPDSPKKKRNMEAIN